MEIVITKGKNRNTLTCKRVDGTITSENLGPDIPNHDIAHYVIEKRFKMKNGFYGKIKSGMTITELSDKDVIKNLGSETWLSEIMSRNLQSIGSGAANIDQYIQLINWEAKSIGNIPVPNMDTTDIIEMKSEFDLICEKWNVIPENGELSLKFE
ncbi:hypothetical protein AWE51_11955 [Aquimarina aggregata]|uniref:Uncharacterized protein n=1 Tax=Aquimarina aggregata TaxID=1642818 RepID=A0A162YNU0_9FLAO|nr:hypothetical protein [Aquimarina aggregata]KZS39257.1 hypothetical protein AWE51_11955 [Aquimarina aggregata]